MNVQCYGSTLPVIAEVVVRKCNTYKQRNRTYLYGECPDCGQRFRLKDGCIPVHTLPSGDKGAR